MRTEISFENEKKLNRYLAQLLIQRRILLILGAGISTPFGLPDWSELYYNLTKKKEIDINKLSKKFEEFRSYTCKGNKDIYKDKIHNALYKKYNKDFLQLSGNETLRAISALVMNSIRGNSGHIITFNFDNILEQFLSYHGFVINPIHQEKYWNKTADVNIIHPHGYLPYKDSKNSSNDIVLDKESFSKIIGKNGHSFTPLIETLMRTHFCIFIGLSGDDQNLDSHLVEVRQKHIALSNYSEYWGITLNTSNKREDVLTWKNRGIFYKKIKKYEIDLPNFLFNICQAAASIKNKNEIQN